VRTIALIPCRSGSKRIPGKNIKPLGGKPLLCWTIEAAQASQVFDRIVVCPDIAQQLPDLGRYYGIEVVERPFSQDDEPDINWVSHVLQEPTLRGYDAFSILRPTSPFRTGQTIRRAYGIFAALDHRFDSLRAVEPVKQHPGKMWVVRQGGLLPICPWLHGEDPWHSSPTQQLPTVYIQNSSLEIAKTYVIEQTGTIAGYAIAPFLTQGMEGFSLDYPEDWDRAERYVADLQAAAAALQRAPAGRSL